MIDHFVDILNSHRGLIYKVCNMYCSDPEDRRDLFQEIVLQVWKSLESFRGEASISTWMYRIALNTAITHLKKEKRSFSPVSISGIDIPDLHDGNEQEEMLAELFKAIDKLDKIDKSIVLLYLEKKSYEEISEITGLTKSNVAVRFSRVKIKLSETLIKKPWN